LTDANDGLHLVFVTEYSAKKLFVKSDVIIGRLSLSEKNETHQKSECAYHIDINK